MIVVSTKEFITHQKKYEETDVSYEPDEDFSTLLQWKKSGADCIRL